MQLLASARGAQKPALLPPRSARPAPWRRAQFSEYTLNFALCCPSRTSILVGQCAHNSGIVGIKYPLGGAQRFAELGLEAKALPYLLQQGGYRTGLVGK